jgi:hypothetical protein
MLLPIRMSLLLRLIHIWLSSSIQNGSTALVEASEGCILELLLEAGADKEARDRVILP